MKKQYVVVDKSSNNVVSTLVNKAAAKVCRDVLQSGTKKGIPSGDDKNVAGNWSYFVTPVVEEIS